MPQLLVVLAVSLVAGVVLASGAVQWPIRPGFVGFAALLVSAWIARRHWQALHDDETPGSPERALWHGLVSYGLLTGHLFMVLWRLGPVMEMHGIAAHALAIDNWMLVFGAVLAYWIARDPEPRRDERDLLIAAHGIRVGYHVLLTLVIVLILALGFGEHTWVGRFNAPMLAHVLILFLLLQCLARTGLQLWLYRRDARIARDDAA